MVDMVRWYDIMNHTNQHRNHDLELEAWYQKFGSRCQGQNQLVRRYLDGFQILAQKNLGLEAWYQKLDILSRARRLDASSGKIVEKVFQKKDRKSFWKNSRKSFLEKQQKKFSKSEFEKLKCCISKFRRQGIVHLKQWFYFGKIVDNKSTILNKFDKRKLFQVISYGLYLQN